ncbi:PQQ-dependent sugar dehydrogenase [Aliagarivorans taiwanensis]|uniref:PQQ-dependent sugar dehydrogenase n=1 Tax=Aliagarivorans taiwanensis TaxID=561966 RepID=UPI0003F598CC|nr:PQQ-dependent sugar dehydrogenase [Aliagarivorans taiwanensis]
MIRAWFFVVCLCTSDALIARQFTTVTDQLVHPWSMALVGDQQALVTERRGKLWRVDLSGNTRPVEIIGLPAIYASGQGGLFDVLPAHDFASSKRLFLSYAAGSASANATTLASARLQGNQLRDVTVLFQVSPMKSGAYHFGGRLAQLDDGTLLLTTGDGYHLMQQSQELDNHLGKLIRIHPDGSVPDDNPFVKRSDALPEIYSYGHRNPQGLTVSADGRIFLHEHGPKGGDEVNLIEPGLNYGWPAITYGVDYSGAEISPHQSLPGMQQPLLHWTPSIAPSGLCYQQQALFVGALKARKLLELSLEAGNIVAQQEIALPINERIRDVRCSPSGGLYILTDSPSGALYNLSPEG